jgi:MOSC domain-containing protein YiiM
MIGKIFISPGRGEEQLELLSAEIVAGKGIVGDRNFGMARWPGQNITFIEAEEIEVFNKKFNRNINLSAARRNIITKGIRLNELVGKVFTIGECSFRGVELCEPCSILGELLANESIKKHEVVRAFVGKGGLRADALSSGTISVNMEILEHKS